MKNFLIGILAGIGNITPGVSGSAILMIFNLYDKCLEAISNIFKNFKKSLLFLFPIGSGIIIGTYSFSKIISYFIQNYEIETKIIFVFFILGTLPSLINKIDKKSYNKKQLLAFIITFVIGITLLLIKTNSKQIIIDNLGIKNIILLLSAGVILASATIIPGISSTILLNMTGLYNAYLNAISNLKILIILPIVIGLGISGFIISKIIHQLFKKYYNYTFFAILGFVIATIPSILPKKIYFNKETLIILTLGIIAFFISYSIEKRP